MSTVPEEAEGEIAVEFRLGDEGLVRRFSGIFEAHAIFQPGPAEGARLVVVADHLPDDVEGPIVLIAAEGEALAPSDARVAATFPPEAELRKLKIALEAAAHGMSVQQAAASSAGALRAALTGREREVLFLLAEGASNKAIARKLAISAHTAKFHVASILEKLGAKSRAEAVMLAVRLGYLMV